MIVLEGSVFDFTVPMLLFWLMVLQDPQLRVIRVVACNGLPVRVLKRGQEDLPVDHHLVVNQEAM